MVTMLYHKQLKIASRYFSEHSVWYQWSQDLERSKFVQKAQWFVWDGQRFQTYTRKRTWWSLATLSNNILVSYKASHTYLGTWKRENILWKQTFQEWIPTHLRTQHTAIPSFKLGNLLSTNPSLKIPSYVKSIQDYNYQSTGTWQWNQCSFSLPQQTSTNSPKNSSRFFPDKDLSGHPLITGSLKTNQKTFTSSP